MLNDDPGHVSRLHVHFTLGELVLPARRMSCLRSSRKKVVSTGWLVGWLVDGPSLFVRSRSCSVTDHIQTYLVAADEFHP